MFLLSPTSPKGFAGGILMIGIDCLITACVLKIEADMREYG
jgi:hypothetical protein